MILFLIGLAAAVLYTGSLYIWPFKPCPRCHGTGRNRGSSKRRFGKCRKRRCDRGTMQRLGSRQVHRAVQAFITYRKNQEK